MRFPKARASGFLGMHRAACRLARRAAQIGLDLWFRALHSSATALAEAAQATGPALGLFLEGAAAASEQAGLEIVAYEFTEQASLPPACVDAYGRRCRSAMCRPARATCRVQAFLLYEESMPDSKQEVRALHRIMGTLQR